MTATATAHETRQLMLDLHRLLSDLDPARWRDEAEVAIRARAAGLETRLQSLLETSRPKLEAARGRFSEVLDLLRNSRVAQSAPRERWDTLREKAEPVYEALAATLRDLEIHVPSLRPTNYKRNVFHVLSAATAIGMVLFIQDFDILRIITGVLVGISWTLESTRRIWPKWNKVLLQHLGPIAHPHEHHRVNSASWYINALFGLALIGSAPMVIIALMVLGLGDPAAAIIGRRFGRIKLIHGRTLLGTLSFVLFGGLGAFVLAMIVFPGMATGSIALLALGGGVVGALAELFSRRIDDNLSVPLAAAGGVYLASWLAGITLVGF